MIGYLFNLPREKKVSPSSLSKNSKWEFIITVFQIVINFPHGISLLAEASFPLYFTELTGARKRADSKTQVTFHRSEVQVPVLSIIEGLGGKRDASDDLAFRIEISPATVHFGLQICDIRKFCFAVRQMTEMTYFWPHSLTVTAPSNTPPPPPPPSSSYAMLTWDRS